MINPISAASVLKAKHNLVITAQMAHWNVRGADYYEAHTLFERIYDDASENTDMLVEVLRALGYTPTFDEFSGPGGSLPAFSRGPLVDLLIERATDYYSKLISFRESLKDNPRAVGLVNLLEDLAQSCTVIIYLLSASKSL
jgi:hypothetical protein